MRRAAGLLLAALGLLPAPALARVPAPEQRVVPRYHVAVELDPAAERLAAEVSITFRAAGRVERLEYLLNAGLVLERVTAATGAVAVSRDTARRGEYRYAAMAEPVTVTLAPPAAAGDTVTLRFRYAGTIRQDAWGTNRIGSDWTELGLYAAWFPLVPGQQLIYELEATLPPGYAAAAPGAAAAGQGQLRSVALVPVPDIPLVAAPALQHDSISAAGTALHVRHTGLTGAQRTRVLEDARRSLDTLRQWLGESTGGSLQLVFAPRSRGGGYARPGFVVLQHDDRLDVTTTGFARHLAHELAHLWWYGAATDTWEDWLNESFAEYCALRLLRAQLAAAEWETLLAPYRDAAARAPALRGLDRNAAQAYDALYRKGPLLLLELEARVGEARMLAFLQAAQQQRAHATAALLDVLERTTNAAERAWLDAALER